MNNKPSVVVRTLRRINFLKFINRKVRLVVGLLSLLIALLVTTSTNPRFVTAQQGDSAQRPVVTTAERFDISPPLRTIQPILVLKPKDKAKDDRGTPGPINNTQHDPDPAVQTSAGRGVFSQDIPPTGANFNGMTNTLGLAPPDPNGDIGPNHYVQMVNLRFQIFNRSGGSLYGPANINTLFTGFGGPCETENAGDPVVLYDQLANRWLLSQFTDSAAPFFNCVAISTTGDPTGSYYRYAFSAPSFPDYPKYGIWPDGYYLNTRESGIGVLGMFALEREQMIVGNPLARSIRFTVTQTGTGPNGLLPSDMDGNIPPPAGSPNYFVGSQDNNFGAASDALLLYKFHADWVNTANSTLTGPTLIPTAPFDSVFPCTPTARDCIPQPGTTVKIDILSYRQRPTFRLAYRNFGTHESLVTSQSVEAQTGIAGMRWYELRSPNTAPTIFQQGTYSPDSVHRWMGSIAMDRQGNMGLGYSVSDGTSVFPGIRYTGRLVSDPLGTMPQGEAVLVAGGGSQTGTTRWGDYSSMSVDPLDDCTFWYTNQYYSVTSSTTWNTRVGSFKFPGCVARLATPFDFDGDKRSDISVFRPSNTTWYLNLSTAGFGVFQFGLSTDKLAPADFDGDGKVDIAVFRDGAWFILQSTTNQLRTDNWGVAGDLPRPGDFDGDAKADLAVFRPSTGTWHYKESSDSESRSVQFGANGDAPLISDFDGDGKSDIAVFRQGNWYWLQSSNGQFLTVQFGASTDIPVAGDYDGDGKTDTAVFRPSNGTWYWIRSSDGIFTFIQFGANGDRPVPGDYDNDGKNDVAVFRIGNWFILQSSNNALIQTQFGLPTDTPVPSAYLP